MLPAAGSVAKTVHLRVPGTADPTAPHFTLHFSPYALHFSLMTSSPPPLDISGRTKRLSDLPRTAKLLMTFGIGSIAVINFGFYTFMMPKFESMFEDMVPGGRSKLPFFTLLVIDWSHLSPVPQVVFLGVASAIILFLWKGWCNVVVRSAATFAILALAAHFLLTTAACFLPLIQVMRSLEQH